MARVAAASRRATPNGRASRRMARQDRKPCSGWGRCSTAHAPFGEDIGLGRQGFEPRPIEFFEELPAGHPEPADRSLLVEPPEQLTDRHVELGEAVEPSVPQATDEPALDNQHAGLDLSLVARPTWPGRQHG